MAGGLLVGGCEGLYGVGVGGKPVEVVVGGGFAGGTAGFGLGALGASSSGAVSGTSVCT